MIKNKTKQKDPKGYAPSRHRSTRIAVPSWSFLWRCGDALAISNEDNDRTRCYKAKTLEAACKKFAEFLDRRTQPNISIDYEARGSDGEFHDLGSFDNALKDKGYV